jgi:hypothetical protein
VPLGNAAFRKSLARGLIEGGQIEEHKRADALLLRDRRVPEAFDERAGHIRPRRCDELDPEGRELRRQKRHLDQAR